MACCRRLGGTIGGLVGEAMRRESGIRSVCAGCIITGYASGEAEMITE